METIPMPNLRAKKNGRRLDKGRRKRYNWTEKILFYNKKHPPQGRCFRDVVP
ncbi:MAG: hypothetical protein ACOCVY_00185 [Patescibacteria group bacterium]